MVLLLDNYDSFTYNLRDYVIQAGLDCVVYRSDEIDIKQITEISPQGIIISPGPGKPDDYPIIFKTLEKFHTSIPILGVCLGYQAIGEFFGMKLIKAPVPSHGKIALVEHDGTGIFNNIPSPIQVTRYHSLTLCKQLGGVFRITSHTVDDIPMSGAHLQLPVWGVQFHPEAILTQYGLKMIKNWGDLL